MESTKHIQMRKNIDDSSAYLIEVIETEGRGVVLTSPHAPEYDAGRRERGEASKERHKKELQDIQQDNNIYKIASSDGW